MTQIVCVCVCVGGGGGGVGWEVEGPRSSLSTGPV